MLLNVGSIVSNISALLNVTPCIRHFLIRSGNALFMFLLYPIVLGFLLIVDSQLDTGNTMRNGTSW